MSVAKLPVALCKISISAVFGLLRFKQYGKVASHEFHFVAIVGVGAIAYTLNTHVFAFARQRVVYLLIATDIPPDFSLESVDGHLI